jgi:hypothetical protein
MAGPKTSINKNGFSIDTTSKPSDATNINNGYLQVRAAITEVLRQKNPLLSQGSFEAIVLHKSNPTTDVPYSDLIVDSSAGIIQPQVKVYFRVPFLHRNLPVPRAANDQLVVPEIDKFSKLKPEFHEKFLISCHPFFYMEEDSEISLDPKDIIEIKFDDDTWSSAKFTKLISKGINDVPQLESSFRNTVIDLFSSVGEAIFLGPSFEASTPDEIKKLALSYDEDTTIPRKDKNAVKISAAHPEMIPYIKAFIYKCWAELKATIRVNSTYRSPLQQQKLYDQWVAGGQQGVKPALPGTSWHNVGAALDFNPTLSDGTTLLKKTSKEDWVKSKVVAIGESLNLRWGGHFRTNYDPIHFDFGKIYNNTQKKEVLTKAASQGVEPTKIEFA